MLGRFRVKKRSGYTLVEMMIVLVIVGILSAGGIWLMWSNVQQARIDRAKGELVSIAEAIEMAAARTIDGTFPADLSMIPNVRNLNDPWNEPYQYCPPNRVNQTNGAVWSKGSNSGGPSDSSCPTDFNPNVAVDSFFADTRTGDEELFVIIRVHGN